MPRRGDPAYGAPAAPRRRATGRSLERLEAHGGDLLGAVPGSAGAGVELVPSAATHAVLPLLATARRPARSGGVGLRSHRRRFGPAGGFWLPECAYEPGLEALLAERDVGWFGADQSAHEARARRAGAGRRPQAGPVAFPIDWEAVSWLWSLDGYPSDPAHRDFHRQSLRGARPWSIGGGPYDPDGRGRAARRRRGSSSRRRRAARPLPRGARAAGPGGVRNRHGASRPLVVGGPGLARGGDRRRGGAAASGS